MAEAARPPGGGAAPGEGLGRSRGRFTTKVHLSADGRCPASAERVRGFGEILTNRFGDTLPTRINAVDVSQLPGLTGFALHLLRDLDAVTIGLTVRWSSGGTEGAVNRAKKIKRQLSNSGSRDWSAPASTNDAVRWSPPNSSGSRMRWLRRLWRV
ncbi:hypothetical protein [Streptomyces griseochromogenes]